MKRYNEKNKWNIASKIKAIFENECGLFPCDGTGWSPIEDALFNNLEYSDTKKEFIDNVEECLELLMEKYHRSPKICNKILRKVKSIWNKK